MTAGRLDEADRDLRIGEAVAAYFAACDAGRAPDREDFLRQHPDLAENLAAYFAQYDQFHHLLAPLRSVSSGDAPMPQEQAQTQADAGATAGYHAPGT